MTKGYVGKGLRIDLSIGSIIKEDLSQAFAEKYIGGYLFGMKLLWDEYKPEYGAFDPRNPIIFSTGPLTGTTAPTGNSLTCNTKSPLTTFVSSRAGGYFGPELKFAGYDYIVITGKSEKPVWIWIDDEDVELRDASDLWGKTNFETDESIKGIVEDRDIQTMTIGPAGENMVKYATINCNIDRAFGRGGAGAVMGSKNLKAIAVRGTHGIEIADMERFKKANKENLKELEERDPWSWEGMPKVGTSGWMEAVNYYNMLPVKNFQENHDDNIATALSADAYVGKLDIRPYSCFSCPLGCSHYVPTIKEGKYAGTSSGTIEYETAAALGARCGIDDIYAVTKANELCSLYGIDTISCGGAIAWAMECYERNLITEDDTGGLKLNFGNADAMVKLVSLIANREGFGNILAEGCYKASEIIGRGTEKYAMHVKGQAITAGSCRTSKSLALVYATNERGAHHMDPYGATIDAYGYTIPEIGIEDALNPFEDGNTGALFALRKYAKLADMLGTCAFTLINVQTLPNTTGEMYSAATGLELTGNDLLDRGEKLIALMRAFNSREGLNAKDDTLPSRFIDEKIEINVPEELQNWTEGQTKIERVVDLQKNISDYYKAAGYDKETGLPSRKRFEELGLDEVADELEEREISLK